MTSTLRIASDSSRELLLHVRAQASLAQQAEAELLASAVDWASFHAEDSLVPAVDQWEQAVPLAGEGTPEVAEFCVAEFAAVLGRSTESGRVFIGDALELAFRLKRTWARVLDGTLPAWRARRIAQATRCLPPEAAAWVDRQVVAFAHRISIAALDRLIEEAMVRFDPDQAKKDRAAAADKRRFDIHLQQVSFNGTVDVSGTLDLKDAFDLEKAVARRAGLLGDLGAAGSLDVRRSAALGEMARDDLTLDLETGERTPSSGGGIELRVHVNSADLATAVATEPGADENSTVADLGLARVAKTRSFIDLDQLREWLGRPGAKISVRGVIDAGVNLRADRYEIPDRIREQVVERDGTCRFPHCNRSAEHADIDHIRPYDAGGPPGQTSSENLACLCRSHHRLKTHGGWSYSRIEPGTFLWRSPHGHSWLVTPSGTQPL
jgi:hypothetical protein